MVSRVLLAHPATRPCGLGVPSSLWFVAETEAGGSPAVGREGAFGLTSKCGFDGWGQAVLCNCGLVLVEWRVSVMKMMTWFLLHRPSRDEGSKQDMTFQSNSFKPNPGVPDRILFNVPGELFENVFPFSLLWTFCRKQHGRCGTSTSWRCSVSVFLNKTLWDVYEEPFSTRTHIYTHTLWFGWVGWRVGGWGEKEGTGRGSVNLTPAVKNMVGWKGYL